MRKLLGVFLATFLFDNILAKRALVVPGNGCGIADAFFLLDTSSSKRVESTDCGVVVNHKEYSSIKTMNTPGYCHVGFSKTLFFY